MTEGIKRLPFSRAVPIRQEGHSTQALSKPPARRPPSICHCPRHRYIGRGIAEDKAQEGTSVQASVIASLVDAWNAP